MVCGTFCHGHYYPVTSVQLLVSLTAKYDWENEESLWGLRQLHHPSTSTAASCVTNAGKLWHYRRGIHKALQPWKPLRKHHMCSIWERPQVTTVLVTPATHLAYHCLALPCWFWYRRRSLKISCYFYNITTVIHILTNILRLYCRKSAGHWASESQMAEAQFQQIRRFKLIRVATGATTALGVYFCPGIHNSRCSTCCLVFLAAGC